MNPTRKHQYRITVEALDASGTPSTMPALQFQARSHDDLLTIVERARSGSGSGLSADDAAAMAVGLKLLGEIALENRKAPLFTELGEHLGAFIQKLKSQIRSPNA